MRRCVSAHDILSGTGTNCAWYTRQEASTCRATSHLPSKVRSYLLHVRALCPMLCSRC